MFYLYICYAEHMGFISKIMEKSDYKEVTISLIGPPSAGKTTLTRFMKSGKPVLDKPYTTLGVEIRKNLITIDEFRINTIDMGGQEVFQQTYWEAAIEQSDAVIFVMDATIREENNLEMHQLVKSQLSYAFDIIPEVLPILILLNKQDLKNANPIQPVEFMELFSETNLEGRSVAFMPSSAKYGDGVESALRWLLEYL